MEKGSKILIIIMACLLCLGVAIAGSSFTGVTLFNTVNTTTLNASTVNMDGIICMDPTCNTNLTNTAIVNIPYYYLTNTINSTGLYSPRATLSGSVITTMMTLNHTGAGASNGIDIYMPSLQTGSALSITGGSSGLIGSAAELIDVNIENPASNGVGLRITNAGAGSDIQTDSFIVKANGRVGVNTTNPGETLGVNGGIKMQSSTGCLMFRDTDDAGWTKCTALDGVLSCAIDADGLCHT